MQSIKSVFTSLIPSAVKEPLKTFLKSKITISKAQKLARKNDHIKLEIGSGPKYGSDGWVTMDICNGCDLFWDISKTIPFPDNSLDMIYSSHVMEHFDHASLVRLLSDCYRMLKPGGIYSACVPNARLYAEGYNNPEKFNKDFLTYKPAVFSDARMDILNYIFYMDGQHKYMFDEENLSNLLKQTGFTCVEIRDFDPTIDMPERKYESLFVQGKKL